MHRFSCVLLVDARGWLLMQERDEHPVIDPDRWGLPGGHVEAGEEFEPAAYRELEEETGIRMAPGALRLWRELEIFHREYDSLDTVQVWVGGTDLTDRDIVLGEGRQIVFVDPVAARALDHTATASVIVPGFLDSADYQQLLG